MGKINDIVSDFKNKLNMKQIFEEELLEACKEGFVTFKYGYEFNAPVIYVNIAKGYLSKNIGQYQPKMKPGLFIVDFKKFIDNNILTNTLVGSDDVYYPISLAELIKHGAKEIKEDA